MSYAVFGASGQTGGATARELLRRKQEVCAVVRREGAASEWQAAGATTALADMYDAKSVSAALHGTDGAFVLLPAFFRDQDPFASCDKVVTALAEGITASGVPHVVYLSSIGAHRDHGLGSIDQLRRLEAGMSVLATRTSALRAGWFMENYSGQLAQAVATGDLPSMLDPLDQPVPMVAVDDIGVAAADLLMMPSARRRVVELSHPKAYSASDVAAAIAEISGRPVTATAIPKADRSGVYAEWGFTPSAARNMSDMIDGFNSGWIRFQGSPAEHVGAPTPLAEALKRAAEQMNLSVA
jgi:NAD(P)H dehydrogenase (quinone)